MRKNFIGFAIGVAALVATSCNSTPEIYKGYDKTSTGAYMKFVVRSGSGQSPRVGDGVSFEMAQYFNDSLLYTTAGDAPIDIILEPAAFVGDVSDALQAMHTGDSAHLLILADSVFLTLGELDVPEEYFGKPIQYHLKLLSIEPKEVLEAKRQRALDSLRVVERDYIEAVKADANNETTASGLVVLGKAAKGKTARLGDYVDFDFMIIGKEGDTLMSSLNYEPVLMQYGEEFVCQGFTEALGLTPQGQTMRFVVPSELGFDSVGYQDLFLPYDPFVLQLKMNEVMDKAAYDKKLQDREAEQEAERQRRLAQEDERIKRYLKENGIDATPTESGLYIVREVEGTGTQAQWGDVVAVHYTMGNLNGDQVESSHEIGTPMRFTVGQGEMIDCIEEAVMTMAPGARVLLVAPSELGFGEFAIHETLLPAYSPLVIELELVSIE